MCKSEVSVGKLRYIYELSYEFGRNMAIALHAKTEQFFKIPENEIDTIELQEKLFEDICSTLPQAYASTFYNKDNNSRERMTWFSFDGFSEWVCNSNTIDKILCQSSIENQGQAINSIPQCGMMRDFHMSQKINKDEINNLKLYVKEGIVNTATVNLSDAIEYLKKEGYAPPNRQRFESYRNKDISWEQFQNILKEKKANSLPQGGSRPETDRIKATIKSCEAVIKQIDDDASCGRFKGRMTRKEFIAMVEADMGAIKFKPHVQTVQNFFRDNERLKPYRQTRGRPSRKTS